MSLNFHESLALLLMASPLEFVTRAKRNRVLRWSAPTTSPWLIRTLPQRLTGINLLRKNLGTDRPKTLPFEESAQAWKGLAVRGNREDTSTSEERHPVKVKRLRATRRRPSALREFFLDTENPEVAHLTIIERTAVRELQGFDTFTQVHTVASDSKLVSYRENLMMQGHHSSKGMKLLATVLRVSLDGAETVSSLVSRSWRMDK